jgi:hypothetical protein
MAHMPSDDVIRIRVDTTRAVEDFLALLAMQAAEGETREPANPAATAIWRELAPLRLVEYAYVDDAALDVDGVFVAFPDGTFCAAADDIPESAVTSLVLGHEHEVVDLPPIYTYVLLAQAYPAAVLDRYLSALATHVGRPLVVVTRDEAGTMVARCPGGDVAADARLARALLRARGEIDRHLSRAEVLACFANRTHRPDGRAYAKLTYGYAQQVLEFTTVAERDEFVTWSGALCDWIFAQGGNGANLDFPEAFRPAELAPVPDDERSILRLAAPSSYQDGGAMAAFAADDGALEAARAYWAYVRLSIHADRETVAG